MNHKVKQILALLPAGLVIILLLVLNIAVLVSGKVFLGQAEEKSAQETETEEAEDNQDTEIIAQVDDFRIERASNVVGKTAETKEKTETVEEYLCADSIVRVLNGSDVDSLRAGDYEDLPEGKDIIQMVVNEIYARNGYQFENEEIQAFFAAKSWYQASEKNSNDMDAVYKQMSDIDKANIDFLKEAR